MSSVFSRHLARVGACALFATVSLAAQATTYTFTTLSRPGADSTSAWDINNKGQIVGFSTSAGQVFSESYVYSGGVFTGLTGPSGAISTAAMGISDAGVVVGSYNTSYSYDVDGYLVFDPEQSFIYSGGVYTTFSVPGATSTSARGISPDGRYVSGYFTTDLTWQAFVLDTATNTFAFTGYQAGLTIAQGINSHGVMVGSDTVPLTHEGVGFIYDIASGTRSDVSLPDPARISFRAIDDAGVISGWFSDDTGQHGFTGYPGAFQLVDYPGQDYTVIEGSNNDGVLVGDFGLDTTQAFIATPVPEPETWALMLAGVALLPLARRRR